MRWTVADSPWPWKGLGNHRAILAVDQSFPAVTARIPWRRRDRQPEKIGVRVFELTSGREVANVLPRRLTREYGEIVFEAAVPGRYAVYYLPFDIGGKAFYAPQVLYRRADYTHADPAWVQQVQDDSHLPVAVVEEIQARTAMDRFDPMELIAGEAERAALLARHSGAAFLLFPEDRGRPIRMSDDLPARWIESGPSAVFNAQVHPNEYFAFQLGLYAVQAVAGVRVEFSDLRNAAGEVISSDALTCFNLGGTDWLGRPFVKPVNVPAGSVQALWMGVDVPAAAQGSFSGSVRVSAEGVPAQTVTLSLTCRGAVLRDRGDGELWKQARLRWLNSAMGLDDRPAAGYPAVALSGKEATVLGRRIVFGATGLPDRICSYFAPSVDRLQDTPVDVLARPIALVAETAAGRLPWTNGQVALSQPGPGAVVVDAGAQAPCLSLDVKTRLEFDGHLDCRLTLTATADCELTDLALEIPMRRDVAVYMMGLGRKGGCRPATWHYEWNRDRSNHHGWLGTVNAGLHLKLKHDEDVWDLFNLHASGFPAGWHNGGRGGCDVAETGADEVTIRAYGGPRKLACGEKVSLRFSLIVTPLKLLDLKAHWRQRYHHIDCWDGRNPDLEEAKRVGATVVNLHQGGKLNPYINYPFKFPAEMRAETGAAHAAGLKYKLYYTVRELSHHAEELWAFRSLNGEIFPESGAAVLADQFAKVEEREVSDRTGGPWLREHLVDRFAPAWHQPLPDGEVDQAIATTGLSRLHNHYIEGLAWLIRELGMDGIYLDGVGYDRQIIKRLRKAMDRARPGSLIDFHSGNNFHPEYGLNNVLSMYMELLPYVDSLWIGEGFDYNESPDYYLTEICGIPFGLANDMLQGGGHPWRGMVYGMTCRYGWQQGGDPQHLWRLWQEFGISDARMFGYWTPDCPVKTDHPQVLATAYVRADGRTLIALASWASEPVCCRLTFDWDQLGLSPAAAVLRAPAVTDFQPHAGFKPDAAIPVEPGRGWLLMLEAPGAKPAVVTSLKTESAQVLPSGNWRVRVRASSLNLGRDPWHGEIAMQAGPNAACAPRMVRCELAPGASLEHTAEVESAEPFSLRAECVTAGFLSSPLRWQPEYLSIPTRLEALPLAALPAWLDGCTGWIVLEQGGFMAARLRLGRLADVLFLEMEVCDPVRTRDEAAFWNGSAVELYLARTTDGPVGQLVLLPPVEGKPAEWLSYRNGQPHAAPATVAWQCMETAAGYRLLASVPLAELGILSDASLDACFFECAVNRTISSPPAGQRRVSLANAAMAHSSAAGFMPLRFRPVRISRPGEGKSRLVAHLGEGRKQTVVAYGTSLTSGGAWVGQLSAEMDRRFPGLATVINSGQGAMWSKWGVENLEERVIARKPDAVFMEFSVNDAYTPYAMSLEESRANLESMMDRIIAANPACEIILMVMNPPTGEHLEYRPQIERYNQTVRDVAEQRRLMLIDHYPAWQRILKADSKRYFEYVPDGIHPEGEGCAAVITPAILNALGLDDEARGACRLRDDSPCLSVSGTSGDCT